MKKRVAIFTNFNSYLKSYSPLIIVEEQIKMFLDAGYELVVIVTEAFKAPEDSVFSMVKLAYIPNVSVSTEAVQDMSFVSDIEFLTQSLTGIVEEYKPEVIITHDMIFLPDYVKHRLAAFAVAGKHPEIKWLNWVHSATSPGSLIEERKHFEDKYKELLGKKFPNSFLVYPNSFDIPRVARNFGYEEDEVMVVPHSTNFCRYNDFHPLSEKIVEDNDLLDYDVIMVYPLRMDRGKQPHILLEVADACERNNMSAAVIVIDFHSTGGDKVTYREEMKQRAEDLNIKLIFTSECFEECRTESPRKMVSDFLTLSNFFVLPSMSETYSLVAQEALMKGNFLVLNHDFLPMRSIYGDMAIYRQFSANIAFSGQDGEIKTEFSDRDAYFFDLACYFKYVLNTNKAIKGRTWVRKERNPKAIFNNFIEPLLYAGEDK